MSDNDQHVNNKNLNDMSIQELRKTATALGIKADRDWNSDDFRLAIDNRRKGTALVAPTMDPNRPPEPGHSRIKLQNNQSGQSLPVPVSVNRYPVKIPRDVVVDVPHEIVEALLNSTNPIFLSKVDTETGKVTKTRTTEPAYPFQLIASTPGVACYPDGRRKVKPSSDLDKMSMKQKYKEIFGKWPKRAALAEFRQAQLKARAGLAVNLSHEEEMKKIAEQAVKEEVANRN